MRNAQSTLLYRWFDEVWNKGDESAIDKFLAHDTRAHGIVAADQPGGAEGFKVFFRAFRDQFHDIRVDVKEVIGQDDMESARTDVSATHVLSGRPVKFTGMCMARIADGKIAEAWNNYDFLDMHLQTGQKLVAAD